MEKTVKKILRVAVSVLLMLACVLFAASCSGVKVTPGGDGSIVITPEGGDDSGGNNNTNNDSQNSGEIHTHTFVADELSVGNNSCTVGGVKIWRCACGASFSENVAPQGHDIRSFEGKAATCTDDGYKPYEKCIRGNCTYTTFEKIPALGHNLKYYADVQPTCTVDGAYDKEECMREGCNYSSQKTIAATGHNWERIEGRPATCTSSGYLSYNVCTVPGCEKENVIHTVIEPLGHDNVHYEEKEPTCTEFGWNEYDVCKRCGNSTYEKVNAKGHSYENGYCSCGHSNPGLHEHVWGDGEIIVEATCTTPGSMEQTCTDTNCGDTQVVEIPTLGHNNTYYAAKAPTCTENGYHAYEVCQRCGYSTYSVDPATGHTYDGGVITASATCTQPGIRTYSCVNGNCDKTVKTETEKLGHDWGNWFVSVEATCTSSGQEQRICFNDSTHVDSRTIPKLGHDWTEYSIIKNPTCTEEGKKKRTCNNDTSHEEIVIIPLLPHDVVLSTGICNICGQQIKKPLATPVITSFDNYVIFWNAVEGADHYQVRVVYNGKDETYETTSLSYSLEANFRECNSLDVQLRAMSPEGSTTPHSDYFQENYSVAEGSIVNYEGVGKTVNLLTNTYTNYGTGTTSIFNKYMFNRLMAGDLVTLAKHYGDNVYTESISEYTNNKTSSIKNKVTQNASIGIDKIGKITGGYTFELDENYTQKTYNQTQAVFYDAYYEYRGYQAGIDGFNNPEILYSLLSDEFIRDAGYLQSREMSPEAFINKYGTHVITAGIYGAKFNAHYEMLADKETLENTGKIITKSTVTAGIEAVLMGIKVSDDVTSETTLTLDDFISSNSTDQRVIFEFSAVGGSHIAPTLSISDFAAVSQAWANSMTNEEDYVLIDVPDGSLYFIWDFLGTEYSEAKKILNDYFYARCDEQLDALNSKINGMYKDFFNFDYETGTLTFNLSALQEPETDTTSLKDVLYMDGNVEIFNGTTGKFIIYPKFSGYDINKVVFEGAYGTFDSQQGQEIDSYFDGVYIVFDDDWRFDRNIEVEFKNFAYHALAGYSALDFSEVSSENITVIATGNNILVGGNGITCIDQDKGYTTENFSGFAGINADNGKSNLVFLGDGTLDVYGGNGINGGTDVEIKATLSDGSIQRVYYTELNGANGGAGIKANCVTIKMSGTLNIYGGNGGNAYNRYYGDNDGDNSDGRDGFTGGNGGDAIIADSINIISGYINIKGGNGGRGGDASEGNSKGKGLFCSNNRKGGDGGAGGCGGCAITSNVLTIETYVYGEINGGNGGNGGNRGGIVDGDGARGAQGLGGQCGNGVTSECKTSIIEPTQIQINNGSNGHPGEGTNGG